MSKNDCSFRARADAGVGSMAINMADPPRLPEMWTGWIWTGKEWQVVCQKDGLGQCAKELERIAQARGVTKSLWQILTRDGKPPAGPPPSTRRRGGPTPC
jgi:hypothetical protein